MLLYGTILYLHGLSKHAQKGLVGQKMVYQDSYRGKTIIAVYWGTHLFSSTCFAANLQTVCNPDETATVYSLSFRSHEFN
jgi:hypothetical protein